MLIVFNIIIIVSILALIMKLIFQTKWHVVKIESNKVIKYEIYRRIFWGFYRLEKTCSLEEYTKFIHEHNIIIEDMKEC